LDYQIIDADKLDAALGATADAIRLKSGGSGSLAFDLANETGFASAVAAIPSGSPALQAKTATENGVVTPDTGYDGLSQVTVNVSGGAVAAENATYYGWTFSGGYCGFAIMERSDGAVFGKVGTYHNNEILTGNLFRFSYYGDGTGTLTVTALVPITLTVYTATTSTATGTALTGTVYSMIANESRTLTNPNHSGGLYLMAEPAGGIGQ
jgi:hypothetical protein